MKLSDEELEKLAIEFADNAESNYPEDVSTAYKSGYLACREREVRELENLHDENQQAWIIAVNEIKIAWQKDKSNFISEIESLRARLEIAADALQFSRVLVKDCLTPNNGIAIAVDDNANFALSKLNSPEPVERKEEKLLWIIERGEVIHGFKTEEAAKKYILPEFHRIIVLMKEVTRHECQGCSSCKGVVVKDGELR